MCRRTAIARIAVLAAGVITASGWGGVESMSIPSESVETCCPVVELRQYTLKPQAGETLVRLFDQHFVEGQERHGMRIIGQFRDLSDPNRFVWLRGFSDMESRREALSAFYSGPVWKEHGPAANETMIDSDDVLLLRPIGADAGFLLDQDLRPSRGSSGPAQDRVVVTVYSLGESASPVTIAALADEIRAAFEEARGTLVALLATEHAANTFPRLPVREGASVLVWIASYPNEEEYRRSMDDLLSLPRWRASIAPGLETMSDGKPREVLLLQPTPRSLLRHRDTSER
ncbi:MAG: NIPSNAP family protein [Vicinamibacteria bacterium]